MNRTEVTTGQGGSGRPLVCLVDTRVDGHHPMYAAVYARALRELGCDVLLVAPATLLAGMPPEAAGHWNPRAPEAVGELVTVAWEAPLQPKAGEARSEVVAGRLWESLGALLDRRSGSHGRYPDLLVHLYLDDFLAEILPRQQVESLVHCPSAGLLFKPPPRWPPTWREAAKRVVRLGRRYPLLRSPRFTGLLLLDASDAGHLVRFGSRLFEVPEVSPATLPATQPDIIAAIVRQAAGRRIYSLVGSIDERKGLAAFLRAAAVAPVDEWLFVIAGKVEWDWMTPASKAELERLSSGDEPRVLLVDGWLEEHVLNAIVACSSLVHVYYYDWPYSTNMFCKTAAHGVPVIAGSKGYIGRMARDHQLGFTVSSPDELVARFKPGFAAAVAAFAESEGFRSSCDRYLAAHNPQALRRVLAELLEHSLPSRTRPRGAGAS